MTTDHSNQEDWPPEQPDPAHRALRAEIYNQAVNAALLINGGAAIALLAFLQVLWEKQSPLIPFVVYGILSFGAGVLFAASVNLARYYTSLHHQRGRRIAFERLRRLTNFMHAISLIAFFVGISTVSIGVLRLI